MSIAFYPCGCEALYDTIKIQVTRALPRPTYIIQLNYSAGNNFVIEDNGFVADYSHPVTPVVSRREVVRGGLVLNRSGTRQLLSSSRFRGRACGRLAFPIFQTVKEYRQIVPNECLAGYRRSIPFISASRTLCGCFQLYCRIRRFPTPHKRRPQIMLKTCRIIPVSPPHKSNTIFLTDDSVRYIESLNPFQNQEMHAYTLWTK